MSNLFLPLIYFSAGTIAGSIVGGLVVLAIIIGVIACCIVTQQAQKKRIKQRQAEQARVVTIGTCMLYFSFYKLKISKYNRHYIVSYAELWKESLNVDGHKKITTYVVWNQGLGLRQAQWCDRVTPVMEHALNYIFQMIVDFLSIYWYYHNSGVITLV